MSTKREDEDDIGLADYEEAQDQRLEPPSHYKVVLINDDFTPMDFVVDVLKQVFGHSQSAASQVMLEVHEKGKGVAGVFTHEIAETKQYLAMNMARVAEHPLMVTLEKA